MTDEEAYEAYRWQPPNAGDMPEGGALRQAFFAGIAQGRGTDGALSAKIARAIDMKQGDKDFALFFACGSWEARLGNTTCVMLGEASGDFIGGGVTPDAAVDRLLEKLQEQRSHG